MQYGGGGGAKKAPYQLKRQVSSSLDFSSLLSVISYNSSVSL